MAERQPSWDKYEAAILLEGILASMKGELTRSDAVKAVSHDLRAMAVHRGIEIDAVYRNTKRNLISNEKHGVSIFGTHSFQTGYQTFYRGCKFVS